MDSESPRSFGRYQMVRRIGQGGMAEVYLAEMVGLGGFRKKVAIKRLLPHYAQNERFVTMLEDEARIAAAIRHPNVAEVLDFGSVDGQHFIAMEYIDGVDLATVLRSFRLRDSLLPLPAALYIAKCVAEGLHAAHGLRDPQGKPQEVIHRDVSPHNILVSYEGAVKLIDFGVAKAANNSTKTRSGVIKGKLQYMSPEQAQAQALDARADIFSLGMTLYKMLTGRLPFTGQNEYQVYDQILRKKPVPPRRLMAEIPERVDAIVLKALRKNRGRRFQTGQEMAELLDIALAECDPDYGARELGELISAEMVAPSTPENLYEEDFIASVSGVDVQDEVDDRDIDRLTDVHSAIKPTPGGQPSETERNPTQRADEADTLDPASVDPTPPDPTVDSTHPDPGPARTEPTPAPLTSTPSMARVVPGARPLLAKPIPVAVPIATASRHDDPPSMDGFDDNELDHTVALGPVDDEDATLTIDAEAAQRQGLLPANTTAQSPVQASPLLDDAEDATLADFSDGGRTTETEVGPIEPSRWPLWVGIGAVAVVVLVVLIFALAGGGDDDGDEVPEKVRIGTPLPGEAPPGGEGDAG